MAQDILIIDDEQDIRDLISGILQDEGYKTRAAVDGVEGLKEIAQRQPSLVILDVWLGNSDRDGLKILEVIKRDHPYVPVVMISGHATIETAVSAIKKGAYDFIEKPFKVERLLMIVKRAIESASLKRENSDLKKKSLITYDLIGQSPVVTQIRQSIDKCSENNGRVMICGPLGSRKESVARQIHNKSRHSQGPFVGINCAAIHPDQIEAEIFGTDIMNLSPDMPRKIGLIEQAHGGTLYFDEVTELSLPTQSKLLKMLQENSFTRIGGNVKIPVEVRVIASSSANVAEQIEQGNLLADFYNRLNVFNIQLPPLKSHSIDIPALVAHLNDIVSCSHGVVTRRFSDEALVVLQTYSWPGNERQLQNVIDWIYINHDLDAKEIVQVEHLPPEVKANIPIISGGDKGSDIIALPLREARETFERDYLLAQINRFGGNISKTARFIGMERSALHRKLKILSIESRDMIDL